MARVCRALGWRERTYWRWRKEGAVRAGRLGQAAGAVWGSERRAVGAGGGRLGSRHQTSGGCGRRGLFRARLFRARHLGWGVVTQAQPRGWWRSGGVDIACRMVGQSLLEPVLAVPVGRATEASRGAANCGAGSWAWAGHGYRRVTALPPGLGAWRSTRSGRGRRLASGEASGGDLPPVFVPGLVLVLWCGSSFGLWLVGGS